jgi:hypothetical protein
MVALIVASLAAWLFAGFALWQGRQDRADHRQDMVLVRAEHQAQIMEFRSREQQLLDQIQYNSQHLPYYPTMGPAEPMPERKYLASDDGLIVFEDLEIDAALREVADL